MNFVVNSNRNGPSILNADVFGFQSYPKSVYNKANIVADRSITIDGVPATNFSLTPINASPLLSAIGPVDVNSNNTMINLGTAFGGPTNPVGGNGRFFVGWNVIPNTVYAANSYTGDGTCRIVSNESFKSGQLVGGEVLFHPLVTLGAEAGFAARSFFDISITSLTLTLKLIDTSGVMVTIGTTTNVASGESSGPVVNTRVESLLPIVRDTFTPIVANDGDRLVVEINMSVGITYTGVLAGGSSGSTIREGCRLELGYSGSDKPISHTQAFRPIQVSVA